MKNNTNDVRLAIADAIYQATEIHPAYINRRGADYPYIIYDLRQLSDTDGQIHINLDIDVVTKDVKAVNTLADSLQDAFDHNVINGTKFFCHTYTDTRYAVVEEDKSIQRIHLQMDLFLYSKEE